MINLDALLRELYKTELEFIFQFDVEDVYVIRIHDNQVIDSELDILNKHGKISSISHANDELVITLVEKDLDDNHESK